MPLFILNYRVSADVPSVIYPMQSRVGLELILTDIGERRDNVDKSSVHHRADLWRQRNSHTYSMGNLESINHHVDIPALSDLSAAFGMIDLGISINHLEK